MAYTTIDDPSAYFQSLLYTGNSSTQSVTFDGNSDLQPDWVWTKCRSNASDNFVFDSNRGVHKRLFTNTTAAEVDNSNTLTSFDSDGFSMGNVGGMNFSSQTYVGWGWKANGGTTASNTDGSITSTVQANTTAGFSIVTYTGNATAGATVGHGLGVVPKWIIVKDRDAAKNWVNYHESLGNDRSITLNTSDAQSASTDHWHNTTPTSSVFYLGDYSHVNATDNFVAYCFAEKQGYSKFGSYTGNGNADGPFVYLGFYPSLIIAKRAIGGTGGWLIWDNKRGTPNPVNPTLLGDSSSAEQASSTDSDGWALDKLSNGFKIRQTAGNQNVNGDTYIYLAFASSPFVGSDGVPTTAR